MLWRSWRFWVSRSLCIEFENTAQGEYRLHLRHPGTIVSVLEEGKRKRDYADTTLERERGGKEIMLTLPEKRRIDRIT